MSKKCAKCEKTVYPVEELKCLEKIWHKTCFKCQVCNMTLSMKSYKGFDKLPYCGAHVPKAKATVIADTPENKRLAENSKTQSTVKYHAEFEANKGRFTQIADDPETLRIKANTDVISNIAYHDVKGQKQDQEKKRSLQGGGENTSVRTPEPGFKTPDPPEEQVSSNNINHDYPKQQPYQSSHQPPPTQTSTTSSRSASASSFNSAHQPTSRSTPPNAAPYQTSYNSNQTRPHMAGGHAGPPGNQPPPYANPPQQPYHQPPQYTAAQQQQLLLQQQQQQQQLKQQQQLQYAQQQQRQAQMYQQQQQQQIRQMSSQKMSAGGHHPSSQQNQRAPTQYQQPPNGYGGPPQQHPGQPQMVMDPRRAQSSHVQPPSAFQAPSQAPAARVPQGMRCYQAMYDYESQDADEVSFRDGDIIINAAFIDEGWMTGTVHRTGQSGMLPANYVEPVNL
eukprot:GFUD01008440.1.p1 GENE.GFUD01008440.1~~GFUD01008440.1.p1  ORF type:complete len:448 (-),score=101.55 GFUD01008440.1:1436-2779(-)